MANLTEIVPASEWAGRVKRSKSEQLHDTFEFECRSRGLPAPRWKRHPQKELRFAKVELGRGWSFDFAWPEFMVAAEIEGLVTRTLFDAPRKDANKVHCIYGRHATMSGYIEDCEKYNAAALLGWTVLRFPQALLRGSIAVDTTIRVLHAKGWRP